MDIPLVGVEVRVFSISKLPEKKFVSNFNVFKLIACWKLINFPLKELLETSKYCNRDKVPKEEGNVEVKKFDDKFKYVISGIAEIKFNGRIPAN